MPTARPGPRCYEVGMNEGDFGAAAYVVVEFSEHAMVGPGFRRLRHLADSGSVRVLDAEFIRSIKGVASTVPAGTVDPDLAAFDHMDSRLLGQADLDTVVDALTAHTMAAFIVYAGGPISAVLEDWVDGGAHVAREGPIAEGDLAAATEGNPANTVLRTTAGPR